MEGRDPRRGNGDHRLSSLVEGIERAQRRRRWLAIPVAVVRKFGDDRGGQWAALIAFYGFFSLFPLLLVFVTVLGFAIEGDPELQRQVLRSALAQFPIIGAQIESDIEAITGSPWIVAVGLAAAVWSGMRVIGAVQGALDELWDVPRRDRPGFVRSRVEALVTLVVLGVAATGIGLLAGVGTSAGWVAVSLRALALAGTVALSVGVLVAIYTLLTEAEVSWRDVVPGAVLGAIGWAALLVIGSWFVDRQIRGATEVYGFFAVVIGLLAWLSLAATWFLLAGEFNVVLRRHLWPRTAIPRDEAVTESDRRALAAEATEEAARPEEAVEVRFDDATDGPATYRQPRRR